MKSEIKTVVNDGVNESVVTQIEGEITMEIGGNAAGDFIIGSKDRKVEFFQAINQRLDRVESKVDRILELLENGELSTSVKLDGKKVAETFLTQVNRLNRRGRLNRDGLTHYKQ